MENQAQTDTANLNPYRNMVIEEICETLDQFKFAFGQDTVDSFKIFIRGLKD
jgi:hypothetical protein